MGVFYRALGFAVWKLAVAHLRRRYGRRLRIAALLAIASIVAGYLGTRSSSSSS